MDSLRYFLSVAEIGEFVSSIPERTPYLRYNKIVLGMVLVIWLVFNARKMLFSGIVFLILSCTCTLANPCGLNVRSFGAKGDGKTLDTEAINQAIEAASASGGGTVYFPAGVYLSHSIHLKDHIRLFLDRGATLKAAVPDGDSGYDLPEPNNSSYQDLVTAIGRIRSSGESDWKISPSKAADLLTGRTLCPVAWVGKNRTGQPIKPSHSRNVVT